MRAVRIHVRRDGDRLAASPSEAITPEVRSLLKQARNVLRVFPGDVEIELHAPPAPPAQGTLFETTAGQPGKHEE